MLKKIKKNPKKMKTMLFLKLKIEKMEKNINGNVQAGGLEQVRAGDGNLRYEFPWPNQG